MKSCKEYDYLPIYYSWDRHCGGGPGKFISRSVALTDSIILAYASSRLLFVSRRFGSTLGAALLAKSLNDIYEAWTGESGVVRETLGDPVYDTLGYATTLYGLTRQVKKFNYLGNPKHDFFIKDPISYESAFAQYSRLEIVHSGISMTMTTANDLKKYEAVEQLQICWERHLARVKAHDD